MVDDEAIAELTLAVNSDQILLRAVTQELLIQIARLHPDPTAALKGVCDSLYDFIDGYSAANGDNEQLEIARESARRDVDYLCSQLLAKK